jgi:signal peptidase I
MITYLLLIQPHQVKGESMSPTLENGEYILTEKISYKIGQPKRGDIIVFKAPPQPTDEFIKRIIGIPGDEILIDKGKVYVNGEKLKEGYLPAGSETRTGNDRETQRIKLGPDEYFVMGDNRNNSYDSRAWGPVKRAKIIGRAWLVYWPPSRFGFIPETN